MDGTVAFETAGGRAILGDALVELPRLSDGACTLLVTSPPFDGPRAPGADPARVIDWLLEFVGAASQVVAPDGSLVMELGSTWAGSLDVRNPTLFGFVWEVCRRTDWRLRQELYWYNPRFLTDTMARAAPDHDRLFDCVTMLLWFSRVETTRPRHRRVRGAYGALTTPRGNFVAFDDSPADMEFLDRCTRAGIEPRQDRFPETMPAYFIELLTDPSDLVVDPFAGTCSTGAAAERLGRRWVGIEVSRESLDSARLRFPAR